MQDLQMEVILFENENPRYNRDADILAQFFNGLREKYPQISIRVYDGDAIERLTQHINLDYYSSNYPIFILNGHVVSARGIPDIKDIENYIDETL